MSVILAKIKEDLKKAMKAEVAKRNQGINTGQMYEMIIDQKTVSRAIISMFPEIGKKPNDATDDDTIKLLKKYIYGEQVRELYIKKILTENVVSGLSAKELSSLTKEKVSSLKDVLSTNKIYIAKTYLPREASEDKIKLWISENIDFSQYRNKMQAMGLITKEFKGVDGNTIKTILLKM